MVATATAETLYGFKFREADLRRERIDEDGHRRYDIKQLWQRSHEILNLALLGHKQTDIAKLLNITPQTVCDTLNSTLGRETLAERRKNRDDEYEGLRDEVMELTRKSLKVYNEILENESENARLKKDTADTVVLELSGLKVPTRIDTRSVHTTLTAEELEEFKRRGIEAARAAGKLVEVDYESKSDKA
jgi:DNA-binding MarR family transcriptional regulator